MWEQPRLKRTTDRIGPKRVTGRMRRFLQTVDRRRNPQVQLAHLVLHRRLALRERLVVAGSETAEGTRKNEAHDVS
jgi:hypothetical protein